MLAYMQKRTLFPDHSITTFDRFTNGKCQSVIIGPKFTMQARFRIINEV